MMFVLGNLFQAAATVLDKLLSLYLIVVFAAVLVQWVRPDPFNPIVQLLRSTTEPLFGLIRRWLPFVRVGGIDLSPVVVCVLIWFARIFLVKTLFELGFRLQ